MSSICYPITMKTKFTYCFDLDGTLFSTPKNAKGEYIYAKSKPIAGRIAIVNRLYVDGNVIIISTARTYVSKSDKVKAMTVKQIKQSGVKYDQLLIGVKPPADFYVDDHGFDADNFFWNHR